MTIEFGDQELNDSWASAGAVVEPSSSKIDAGWVSGERPPYQTMNWLQNLFMKKLNYLTRKGIPEWSANTNYLIDDIVTYSGVTYIATANNLNEQPDTSSDWGNVGSSGSPSGVVVPFAGSAAPEGYLLCDGAAVSRSTYADLFGVVGEAYGAGNGSTTFNLPDLRGRGVFGKDDMGGTGANRLTGVTGSVDGNTLGAAGGSELTSLVADHTHSLTDSGHTHGVTDPGHIHVTPSHNATGGFSNLILEAGAAATGTVDTGSATTGISIGSSSSGISVDSSVDGGSVGNMNPALILNYIIKT